MQIPGYRIIRKISQGGMSTVYLAVQLSVGREVALKIMSSALTADPDFSQRFQREATIVGQLSHAHIVAIYDVGLYGNLNYIAMEYLPGGSLQQRLRSGISARETLRIVAEVSAALDYAHQSGYVHRDIKPENILFRSNGSAVLTDFGVARSMRANYRATHTGTMIGTPHYMSPEQARDSHLDGRSDLYSLGIVFYEMLTGSVPYQADEAVAIALKHLTAPLPPLPDSHHQYQPLLQKLLAKEPGNRFQRGQECIDYIQQLQTEPPQSQPLPPHNPTLVDIVSVTRLLLTMYAGMLKKILLRWLPAARLREARVVDLQAPIAEDTPTLLQPLSRLNRLRLSLASRSYLLTSSVLVGVLLAASVGLWLINQPTVKSPAMGADGITSAPATPPALTDLENNTDPMNQSADPLRELIASLEATAAANNSGVNNTAITNTEVVTTGNIDVEKIDAEASDREVIATEIITQNSTPEPPPQRYPLRVETQPANARIRILNIGPRYHPGIELLPGAYHIEVTASGYEPRTLWLKLGDAPLTSSVNLVQAAVAGSVFQDALKAGGDGPEMVVIPAGRFNMGSPAQTDTQPVSQKIIARPFAAGRFEITFADFAAFSQATNTPMPADQGWGRERRPLINISWDMANRYVSWLSEQTGKRYRLLTELEWEYIAKAGADNRYAWGNQPQPGAANCHKGCDSQFVNFLRAKSAPVGTYAANPFGLYDLNGNVAEWVADCYQPDYQPHSPATTHCHMRSVRGGSMLTPATQLGSSVRDWRTPDKHYKDVGLRVALDL